MRRLSPVLALSVAVWLLFGVTHAEQTQSPTPRPRTDAEALALRGKTPAHPEPSEHAANPSPASDVQQADTKRADPRSPDTKPADVRKSGGAKGAGGAEPKAPEIVAQLLAGNGLFASQHNASYFAPFAKSQQPKVTLLTCSDSRVQTQLFGGNPDNYFFVVRDIGNQMQTAQGSVDYGIQHLGTPVLLIMGHSGCGAVKAAMGDFHEEDADIVHELEPLLPGLGTSEEGEFDNRWAQNIQSNVDFQVRQALATYRAKVQDGSLTVIGAVYDFQNLFGKGPGTMVIVNVNGETELNRIREEEAFRRCGLKEIESHLSRLGE
ncbi:MAG: carbonic anhydrase [Acidobacteriota bacterium]